MTYNDEFINTRVSAPGGYQEEGSRRRLLYYTAILCLVMGFLLPLFLRLHLKGLFLWLCMLLVFSVPGIRTFYRGGTYVVSHDMLEKKDPRGRKLWKIRLNTVVRIRRAKHALYIYVPKKTYVVYTTHDLDAIYERILQGTSKKTL